ncbi:sigma-70 family RNA polymerase sigma factor [Ralstonia pickettii]|nr:sigma-70 family RNA polymerase sigma factor [Ralstonia pickettii]
MNNMSSQQLESWADKLLLEYGEGRKDLSETKSDLNNDIDYLVGGKEPHEIDLETKELINVKKEDIKQISSMIRDMTFSMNWMKIGREPGKLRGIDRRSVYQRRVIMDMDLYPSLDIEPEQEELTNEDKSAIVDVLIDLSVRERQCYILHNAYRMSMADIGKEIGVSKSSVQKYIVRAKEKVNKKIVSYDCHTVAN